MRLFSTPNPEFPAIMISPQERRFNPLVADIAPPPIPLAQTWLGAYSGQYGPGIDLSQAVPGYPPHPDVLEALARAAGSLECAGYGAIEGEAALQTAYADHLTERYDSRIEASGIHITSGCNQAFFATMMAIAGPGDTVLMSNPCYFNHEATLSMLGIGITGFDCRAEDGFAPNPAAIEHALSSPAGERVKAIALVSPNNPTGAVYSPDLLGSIFEMCAAKGVWMILDETYRDFLDEGHGAPHDLFSHPGWRNTFIQLYSFSKSFCIPGHRVGAITAGVEAITQIAKIMDNLQICAPRAPQIALAETLPALADWRAANAREISGRASEFIEALSRAAGWDIAAIGAYFAYVRHPFAGRDSVGVAQSLARDFGVLGLPGQFFGTGQGNYLRLAFANVDVPTIRQVPDRLNAMTG